MRHLGEKKINERLPLVRDLARSYVGADPVTDLVPVRPAVHYMMGGIQTDAYPDAAARAVCRGRMRLQRSSTAPTASAPTPWPNCCVRPVAGEQAAVLASQSDKPDPLRLKAQAAENARALGASSAPPDGDEKMADIRTAARHAMEDGHRYLSPGAGHEADLRSSSPTCATLPAAWPPRPQPVV